MLNINNFGQKTYKNPAAKSRVDMLWVVDDSPYPKMGNNNFNSIINTFKGFNDLLSIDLGLLLMGESDSGYLRCYDTSGLNCSSANRILRREFDDFGSLIGQDTFHNNTAMSLYNNNLKQNSSVAPVGFKAIENSLSSPILTLDEQSQAHNDILFLNNIEKPTFLSVIYVSDRKDVITDEKFQEFTTFFKDLKNRSYIDGLVFHALACPEIDERGWDLALEMGGLQANICLEDPFSSSNILKIAQALYSPLTKFYIDPIYDFYSCKVEIIKSVTQDLILVNEEDLSF